MRLGKLCELCQRKLGRLDGVLEPRRVCTESAQLPQERPCLDIAGERAGDPTLRSLGGALTLTQLAHGATVKKPILIGVLVVVALSGVLAFSGAEQIVRARLKGEAVPKRVYHLMRVASFVLAMGVGGILQLFVKAI